jgi:hypothetical protein
MNWVDGATSGIQGISCTADGDCNGGLKCLELDLPPDSGTDAGCNSSGKRCLIPCTTNAECANAGPGLTCFAGCTGVPACVPESYVVPLGVTRPALYSARVGAHSNQADVYSARVGAH